MARDAAQFDVHTEDGGERVATVLPGRGYTCDAPLLHFTRLVLRTRGWTVRTVRWRVPPSPAQLLDAAPDLLDAVPAPQHLVVAKSLGTWVLPLAVERGLAGVWFTPLLHEDRLLQAAVGSRSPTLLVGGSADPSWDSGAAAASGQRVLEVAGADHSLEVAGDVAVSIHALEQVVSEVEAFLDVLG